MLRSVYMLKINNTPVETENGLVQLVPPNPNWKNGRGLFLQDRENIELLI